MQEKSIQFFSDQILLRGILYLPDDFDPDSPLPGIIVCSGYTGLNAIYPRLFAEALTPKQIAVLGFDYRGCGESDGERGRLLLEEQVRDIRNSVTFFKYQDSAHLSGMGLLGWGMGAGLVLAAAERNLDIRAVAGVNGFYDGASFLKSAFSEAEFNLLPEKMETDRRNRVFRGKSRFTDPFEAYPLDPDTASVVDERLRPVKDYEINTSFELAESIHLFSALTSAASLVQPLLIAHGKNNRLHPVKLAGQVLEAAPAAEYFEIDGKHNDFMTLNDPEFGRLIEKTADWFKHHL